MQMLYLDCDGVILDTIDSVYNKIINSGKELNEENVGSYYRNLDWYNFILEVGDINNAISNIRKLLASGKFEIKVLTHVNSIEEGKAKIKYFSEVLPSIEVIPVPKSIQKADFVDPTGAILVDDFTPNLDYWHEKGGIPIKFSSTNKECNYLKIFSLDELLQLEEVISERRGICGIKKCKRDSRLSSK